MEEDLNMVKLARLTPGYVGADLKALAREAAMCAVNRLFCFQIFGFFTSVVLLLTGLFSTAL